jgi:hypothetical protein
MVQKIAQDGMLVVTWANWHYQDFVRTWIKHVQAVGITGYIVGAMDDHLLQVCGASASREALQAAMVGGFQPGRRITVLEVAICTHVCRS